MKCWSNKEEIWKDWEVFRIFNTNGHAYIFFIPIDLYRPSIRIYVCVCMYVYVRMCIWEREKLLMRRLSIIHHQFVFLSPFLDHSYESFSFLFISYPHIQRYINWMGATGMQYQWSSLYVYEKKFFFSYFLWTYTYQQKKTSIKISFIHSLFPFVFLLSQHDRTSNIHRGLYLWILQ